MSLWGDKSNSDSQFYFENPCDTEESVTAVITDDGGLQISVSEEQAMDSYNATFECSVHLPKDEVLRLMQFLVGGIR